MADDNQSPPKTVIHFKGGDGGQSGNAVGEGSVSGRGGAGSSIVFLPPGSKDARWTLVKNGEAGPEILQGVVETDTSVEIHVEPGKPGQQGSATNGGQAGQGGAPGSVRFD